jgi:RNA polymerase sigma-70 factor (ECF subfamily)
MNEPSQDELLRAAFKYQDALVGYAYGLSRDWPLAQDAVQEAYLALVRKWREYTPEGNLFLWVRQMVRFEVLNLLRARGREKVVERNNLLALVDREFARHLDEGAAGRTADERRALTECMSALKKSSLDLIVDFYRNAVPCERLAALHRCTANAVRLSLSRLRKQLRECMSYRLAAKGL